MIPVSHSLCTQEPSLSKAGKFAQTHGMSRKLGQAAVPCMVMHFVYTTFVSVNRVANLDCSSDIHNKRPL